MTFTTEYATHWAENVYGTNVDEFYAFVLKKGRAWLRIAGIPAKSDDVALAVYLVWRDVSDLFREDGGETDYLAVGGISDQFSDHDCELLAEIEPEIAARACEIGSMPPEAAGLHVLLEEVSATMVERWATEEEKT